MCFSTTQRFLGGSTMKTRIWPGMLGTGGPGEQTQAFRVLTDKKKTSAPWDSTIQHLPQIHLLSVGKQNR